MKKSPSPSKPTHDVAPGRTRTRTVDPRDHPSPEGLTREQLEAKLDILRHELDQMGRAYSLRSFVTTTTAQRTGPLEEQLQKISAVKAQLGYFVLQERRKAEAGGHDADA